MDGALFIRFAFNQILGRIAFNQSKEKRNSNVVESQKLKLTIKYADGRKRKA
jgi:hypothetical protein